VDSSGIFIVVLLAWALFGVSTALVMGRRGHQPFMWLVLAITFGPLVVPLAGSALRHHRGGLLERLSVGRAGTGTIDVLAGIDGSTDAEQAIVAAIHMLGSRLGRTTLAAVVDYDIAARSSLSEDCDRAKAEILRAVSATGLQPATILLAGRPAEALRKHALEEGYELIVVGRRGRGASRLLMGSVASELARGGEVPVLVV
jgi:nucleotide-binding universal stress UspA family protein